MKTIIQTAIVTAFTIAAALIWRDAIIEIIEQLVPPGEEVFYKIVAALIATVVAIIAIYLFVKTEEEAEYVLKKLKKLRKPKNN